MPNWSHLFTNLIIHLGLALWIGGTIVLGALTAPALFRSLPRPDAGAIFGLILRRFARLRLAALVAVVIAEAVKHVLWESGAIVWISIRWAALIVMAATLLMELGVLEKAIEARRMQLSASMPEDHPERRAFNVLHKRAENVMKLGIVAALVALLMS